MPDMQLPQLRYWGAWGWILWIALGGCSRTVSVPETFPVKGQVLFRGKPLPGVRVTFHPQQSSGKFVWKSEGLTGPQGEFTLSTGAIGNGVPPGEYAVTFEWPRVVSDRNNSGLETEVDVWQGKYADAAHSPFRVIITKGSHVLEPFELEQR
ncbi:MAG: hypothetical protein KatS3mg114_0758 [Planctomycetaceae bacterium]|nr:MAG: hypothetical protein KatS3mg114_0758 [Planctomycetaceae bacterium]